MSPNVTNGDVKYRIFKRMANESVDVKTFDDYLETSVTVEKLEEFINYTISVQAFTSAGNADKVSISERTDSASK